MKRGRPAKQVSTVRKRYGTDHYSVIGSLGGKERAKAFTPEYQKEAINARWKKYYAERDS